MGLMTTWDNLNLKRNRNPSRKGKAGRQTAPVHPRSGATETTRLPNRLNRKRRAYRQPQSYGYTQQQNYPQPQQQNGYGVAQQPAGYPQAPQYAYGNPQPPPQAAPQFSPQYSSSPQPTRDVGAPPAASGGGGMLYSPGDPLRGYPAGTDRPIAQMAANGDIMANPQDTMFPSSPDIPLRELPMNLPLEETQTGRLMFGVGVNSDAGLVGNVTIDEQNFDWRNVPESWEDIWEGRALRGAGERFRMEVGARHRGPALHDQLSGPVPDGPAVWPSASAVTTTSASTRSGRKTASAAPSAWAISSRTT